MSSLIELMSERNLRLVTLTGPGGVGKTRLALEVGARLMSHFEGSVAVVDLAPVGDATLVMSALAHGLGLREVGSVDLASVIADFLAERPTLVVLDNLEHVLGCAPAVAELVARCPRLVVLITSRAALRVRAEVEVPLAPLQVPDPRVLPDATRVAESAAARMFLSRAEAAAAPLTLTEENAATIAAICWRLDGLPLALELAAARARLLSPTMLLARLDDAIGSGGMRDAPERQRTMRATLNWSYDLLGEYERSLFRRLSVFIGGFSLEAVEEVADATEDPVVALGALVEQSLVARTTSADDQQTRFRVLEPVRQYASDLLSDAGEAERTRELHADHFRALAHEARTGLRRENLRTWLDRLEQDHGNLGAAMQHLLGCGGPDLAANLGWDLWLYWGLRGHVSEGVRWTASVLEGDLSDTARCRALGALAGLRFVSGEIPEMRRLADEALSLARLADGDATVAEAAILAGSAAMYSDNLPAAAQALDEALLRAHAAEDEWAVAHALTAQGQLALLGGDVAGADQLLTTAEQHARGLRNAFTLATVLNVRATLTELRDEPRTTAELLGEAIEVSASARISWTRVYTLTALAGVAARCGQPEYAARLFGASASLSSAHLVDARFPASRQLADRHLTEVRRVLGEAGFRHAFELGKSSTLPEVAELAAAVTRSARG